MSKGFKVWDRKFRKHMGELALVEPTHLAEAELITCWPHPITNWGHDSVRECVYEEIDSEVWQKFRVGLKGLPTKHKLFRLLQWRRMHTSTVTEVRVDNYIGALIRGGQLDTEGNVVR